VLSESGKQSVVLANVPKTEIVSFLFVAGYRLAEHVAPFDATTHIVSEKATLTIGDQTVEDQTGTLIKIVPKTPPWVHCNNTSFDAAYTREVNG
jgi:quercetin dioxygenase-like cupin family protein